MLSSQVRWSLLWRGKYMKPAQKNNGGKLTQSHEGGCRHQAFTEPENSHQEAQSQPSWGESHRLQGRESQVPGSCSVWGLPTSQPRLAHLCPWSWSLPSPSDNPCTFYRLAGSCVCELGGEMFHVLLEVWDVVVLPSVLGACNLWCPWRYITGWKLFQNLPFVIIS